MNDKLIDQWEKAVKKNTDQFNQAYLKNVTELGNTVGKYWDFSNAAKMWQTVVNSSQEVNKTNETVFNNVMKTVTKMMNFQASAASFKEFNGLSNDAATRLFKTQQDWINIIWDSDSTIISGMAKARNAEDVVILILHVISDMNSKMKDNFINTLQLCSGLDSAVKTWGSKTLRAEAAGSKSSGSASSG
ncbi:MAG: hypothetical protein GY874_14855 [Desulfobacteraceae bacterium]|nr:hypothetical protein [Desulfobacteraceae bacterium]